MTSDTRIALFLTGELVAALRANDPYAFKCWLPEGDTKQVWMGDSSVMM